jgi:DNA-binding transcriptional LysR family regulator
VTEFSKAPGEWEWQVFIAVAETGGTDAAAQRLRAIRGSRYGRQAVEKTIAKIQSWAGEPLLKRDLSRKLHPTERGQEILEGARKIVAQYRLMRGEVVDQALPKLACLPLHTHFVAVAEDILFHEPEAGTEKMVVEYLPQDQRGEGKFHGQAVEMLESNVYQLIIGPRVRDANAFASTTLYHAQLEAMVSADHPEEEMSLVDLVSRHRMLVPPRDMRSRRLLEDAIKKWVPDVDPGEDVRVAAETYETATSVMRLRHESSRRRADSRVVVVPSDVALAYKEGMEFGGRNADRFKWVPIYYRDEGGEHLLRMEVCVTVRRGNREKLANIVGALHTAVERLNNLPDQVGLDGSPFRQEPLPVPSPRSQPGGGRAVR